MSVLIEGTTGAKISNPFVVQRGETVGVSAYGLGVGETAVIQRLGGNGEFVSIIDSSGTLTDTEYQTKITASGTYRVSKTVTVAKAGVDID